VDLRISARNLNVSERFKEYAAEKSAKVEQYAHRPQELNVKITRYEHHSTGVEDQVELTVYEPGHVVRAEARAADKFAAFDIAFGKLVERLRRYSDKHKIHRGGNHKNLGASELAAADFAQLDIKPLDVRVSVEEEEAPAAPASPIAIRAKEFPATPMTKEQAVDHMELVGHDFYLFQDSESGKNAVVYRRKGYSYGVISLS
jgi:ribosomal subunit interface protein